MPWIQANIAWTSILEGDLEVARNLLYSALDPPDFGREMSINVFLAVLDVLEDRLEDAKQLLLRSLSFYRQSDDQLSVVAIQFHLTYIALREQSFGEADEYIAEALRWAAERSVDYFPHWWYPQMVGEVCAHALTTGLYPHLLERMFIKHIRQEGIPLLRPLLRHPSALVRRRAGNILEAIGEEPIVNLNQVKDRQVREVLKSLIETGELRPEAYEHLSARLRTGEQRDKTNPVLVATFGLYVHGRSRREIASLLGRSEATIRNYIEAIYSIFALPQEDFETRQVRRCKLHEVARREGFV